MADVEVGNKSQRSSDIAKSDNFGEDNNAKNTDDENVERIENNVQDVSGRNYTVAQNSNMTIKKEDKGCCCRCWNAIFRFFANDRIYGSFVGPHPVSLFFFCTPCKCCCKGSCIRPFALASVATKMMWFIMLIVIILLSCFFIIPYPKEANLEAIADFYPCVDVEDGRKTYRPVKNTITNNCWLHGGYFMVYRNFFAFSVLLLMNVVIMIGVRSTKLNPNRAKMHHGFWMYKYILLFVFLLTAYTGIRVVEEGIFEYVMSWVGLISSLLFSFIEMTFMLDLVEIYITNNRASKSDWADFSFWCMTILTFAFDFGLIFILCFFYVEYQYDIENLPSPHEKGGVSILHLLIVIYGILLSLVITTTSIVHAKRTKDYTRILRSGIVIAYVLGLVWSALGVSPDIYARPSINVYRDLKPQPGNLDTYFKADGCFQGLSAIVTLMYYIFWHGPRSQKAPMSVLFDKIVYWKAKKPEVPVVPKNLHENDDEAYTSAVSALRVWDDEKVGVRYSWSIFYTVMILGSLTIMMGMTNFADPWAVQIHCSSYPALGIKLSATVFVSVVFIVQTLPRRPKIIPNSPESPEQTFAEENLSHKNVPSSPEQNSSASVKPAQSQQSQYNHQAEATV